MVLTCTTQFDCRSALDLWSVGYAPGTSNWMTHRLFPDPFFSRRIDGAYIYELSRSQQKRCSWRNILITATTTFIGSNRLLSNLLSQMISPVFRSHSPFCFLTRFLKHEVGHRKTEPRKKTGWFNTQSYSKGAVTMQLLLQCCHSPECRTKERSTKYQLKQQSKLGVSTRWENVIPWKSVAPRQGRISVPEDPTSHIRVPKIHDSIPW
jgi:hypothetical protein